MPPHLKEQLAEAEAEEARGGTKAAEEAPPKMLKEKIEATKVPRALGAAEKKPGEKSEEMAKQKQQGDQKGRDHDVSLSDDDTEDESETDSIEEITRRIAKEDL